MEFENAIKTIIESGEEIKAVKILLERIEQNIENLEKRNSNMSFCLNAIQKINRNKNEAIDALCEPEEKTKGKY